MQFEFSRFEKKLIDFFFRLELKRKNERFQTHKKNILPNYVLKRHIKIISNGKTVFDSNDFKDTEIPISIQYSIKQYGYPKIIKPNNKTPLIYNITTTASSIFSSEEEQEFCMRSVNNKTLYKL